MPANFESIEEAIKGIRLPKIVSCPLEPCVLTGSDSATALESGDTLGTVFQIRVPKSGEIRSVMLYDFDDKGIQVDLEIFTKTIANVAVDSAFAPTDAEGLTHIAELNFAVFDDHGNYQTSELCSVGKAYTAPDGVFYIQGVTRGTPTVTAGSPYQVQFQILSFDPTFVES